jgi:hypothetical protein
MGGMCVYKRLLLCHGKNILYCKTTRVDQDVCFRFVIQHGMNNGFGPKRCTTFVFHLLQLHIHCFLFDLKYKYFTFNIYYNILHLQIIHLCIHKCRLTLDQKKLFLFNKKNSTFQVVFAT